MKPCAKPALERRDTGQPYLDKLFNAAVDCTGDQSPDNWEPKGIKHINGKCGRQCKCKTSTNGKEIKSNTGLTWKLKTFQEAGTLKDDSFWHSAYIKELSWEFVVDNNLQKNQFDCFLFPTAFSDEVKINKKPFKTPAAAKKHCEKYLNRVIKGVQKKLNTFPLI